MNAYKVHLCFAVALLAGACADMSSGFSVSGDQNTLKTLGPAGDPFQEALVQGYKKQADEDYAEGNYRSAHRYYVKSIDAQAGKVVVMEDPANWTMATGVRDKGLYGADLQMVVDTRAQLAPWIEASKRTNPQAAATQQVKFDCWTEELAEQQYDQAALCKPTIQVAAATPVVPAFPPVAAAPAPTPQAAAPVACAQNPDGYNQFGTLCRVSVVTFAFDRYDLLYIGQNSGNQTAVEQAAAIDQIMRQVSSIKPARIDVMGRADTSGPDTYNYGLSDCRARSVVAALRTRGLPMSVETRIVALGSTDLIVPTDDEVREGRNRVVMVAYQTDRDAPVAARAEIAPTLDTFGCGTSARHPFPAAS